MQSFVKNPAWRLDLHDDTLIVSAGADEVLVLDEAPASHHAQLLAAWAHNACAELWEHSALGAAVRQLRRLGALLPEHSLSATSGMCAAIRWWGTPVHAFADALASHGWQLNEQYGNTLQLHVRTDALWETLLREYTQQAPEAPHLLIDLTHHHTVCAGPLVVPGQTACIACLGHRLLRRWGDLASPPTPAMCERAASVAALLADGVMLGSRFVERCVALDLRALSIQQHSVFPMPECPVCERYRDKHVTDGMLPLPWLNENRPLI